MEQTDDSTAVVRIRSNFYDFISTCPPSTVKRLDFDSSLGESFGHVGKDKSMQQSKLIGAKAHVTQLQSQLVSLETQHKKTKLEHSQEIERLNRGHQKDLETISDLKHQLLVFAKKENERKRELTELKLEFQKAKEFKRNLETVAKEKNLLEEELDQKKHDLEMAKAKAEMEMREMTQSHEMRLQQLQEIERLQLADKSNKEINSQLEQTTEDLRSQLATANMKVKEMELTFSRMEEDAKVFQIMKSQLSQLKQLEKENKVLQDQNQYLSAIQQNTHLLTEEKRTLNKLLERTQERCNELSTYEVLYEDLQRQLTKWESIDDSSNIAKSPTHMRQQVSELQHEIGHLLEKNGQLQASNHVLEEMQSASAAQLQNLKAELASTKVKLQELNDIVGRFKKKLIFVSKEKEHYQSILDMYNKYDGELTISVDTRSKDRIQHLESALESHRKHIASLESDLEQSNGQVTKLRLHISRLDLELQKRTERQQPVAVPTTSAADQNIILGLREKVAELEKKVEELLEHKEVALAQLERVDMQGGYDSSKTRVIHMRMNPYSMTRNRHTQEMERLREENARLVAKVKVLEETGGPVEGLSVIVDEKICPPGTAKQLEETKSQLASEQLKNQRLMEAFKKTSQELRDVTYKVLGYRIDIPNPEEYRLMSMYAETPNDFLLFKHTPAGELHLLANDYSASFRDKVETYLNEGNSFPAFMSSVTLDLFSRQTMMQS